MTIDNINDVVNEFVKRLQLPESKYKFMVTSNNEIVELIISIDDEVKMSLKITNGNISVLYTDEYNSDKYVNMEFQSTIMMLYQICILFCASLKEIIQIDFNDILSVLFLNDVYDWKTLCVALCENLNLNASIIDDYVTIEELEIHYNTYTDCIRLGDTEIFLDDGKYTTVVEAIFKCVEYVANIMDVADDLFLIPEEEEITNVSEIPEEGGDMNINMDMDMGEMPESSEEPAPVEPIEQETFEEPQSPVVTMDDLV